MKVMAFNGSPRKSWNTATLIEKTLEGARSRGAQTELVHLYDVDYKGCRSCFACKLCDGKSYGRCGAKDGLSPILERALKADAILLGSPIYVGYVTGQTQSFLERLVFPKLTYTDPPGTLFERKIKTGVIYTMGLPEEMMKKVGYEVFINRIATLMTRIFGHSESLCCFDTLQFDDYSKYHAPRFDPKHKAKRRKEAFPEDCRKAFELGVRLATS